MSTADNASVEAGLSQEERRTLQEIDEAYTDISLQTRDMDQIVEAVKSTLREADKENKEIELFSFHTIQRDAVGILAESGEAKVYRGDDNRVFVRSKNPSFVRRLLSLTL